MHQRFAAPYFPYRFAVRALISLGLAVSSNCANFTATSTKPATPVNYASGSSQRASVFSDSCVASSTTPDCASYEHPWQPDFSGQSVIGGTRSAYVNAPADMVFESMCRVDALVHMLPCVHEVTVIRDWDDMHLWRVTHSLGVFRGDYVLRLQCLKESENSYFMRFRVDTRYPRDVKDGWGNVRIVVESSTQTRLDYQARAVLYPGVLRWLFSSRIETAMLVVPNRARDYVHRLMRQRLIRSNLPVLFANPLLHGT